MARHSVRGRESLPPISAFSPARSLSRSTSRRRARTAAFAKCAARRCWVEIRGTLAQRTDRPPRRGALRRRAGYARRRPRPPSRRARVYRRQGAVVHGHRRPSPIPSAYPRPERTTQFLTGRSPRSRWPESPRASKITNKHEESSRRRTERPLSVQSTDPEPEQSAEAQRRFLETGPAACTAAVSGTSA